MEQHVCNPGGTPTFVRDATANDSDKTFTVPTGKRWELRYMQAELACTATVGNRLLLAVITNGTNNVWTSLNVANAAASAFAGIRIYWNGCAYTHTTTFRRLSGEGNSDNPALTECGPVMVIPAGYTIRVYDVAAIDAAADDLTVVLHYVEYDV